ncbi:hypothetical protein KDW_42080 [Dictyobacter vulcani]|uniref:Uncharacterized protein n=1 Tax=Dictyobacter vulcani TaxID=2607529 RepID=A0A5J4KY31_9CHLR|nr:hypothetical protein KDW_42080 [Dictyobacter vulcani]
MDERRNNSTHVILSFLILHDKIVARLFLYCGLYCIVVPCAEQEESDCLLSLSLIARFAIFFAISLIFILKYIRVDILI